jgi:hypothetical protein
MLVLILLEETNKRLLLTYKSYRTFYMAEIIKFYKKDKAVLLFLHFLKSFLVSFNFLNLVVLILQRQVDSVARSFLNLID